MEFQLNGTVIAVTAKPTRDGLVTTIQVQFAELSPHEIANLYRLQFGGGTYFTFQKTQTQAEFTVKETAAGPAFVVDPEPPAAVEEPAAVCACDECGCPEARHDAETGCRTEFDADVICGCPFFVRPSDLVLEAEAEPCECSHPRSDHTPGCCWTDGAGGACRCDHFVAPESLPVEDRPEAEAEADLDQAETVLADLADQAVEPEPDADLDATDPSELERKLFELPADDPRWMEWATELERANRRGAPTEYLNANATVAQVAAATRELRRANDAAEGIVEPARRGRPRRLATVISGTERESA